MRRVRLIIDGMNCAGCVRKISFFLHEAGAKDVEVHPGLAEFSFSPPEDLDRYVEIVENAGHYKVVEVAEVA